MLRVIIGYIIGFIVGSSSTVWAIKHFKVKLWSYDSKTWKKDWDNYKKYK